MRDIRWENITIEKIADDGIRRIISSFFLIGLIFISVLAMVSIFNGNPGDYTPVTKVCISCHNDSDYPNDTNFDGVRAPYKRPHNDTVMCESCHRTNPHTLTYIQQDGSYGMNITAASCPECHSSGIPSQNNSNFSSAPMIPVLRHSSSTLNGSIWGNYWTNTSPKTACVYCHNNTLHNTTPFGRILQLFPDYQRNGYIGVNLTCAGCHYKGDPKWSRMNLTFTSAGLPTPPEITNGTNWNGISHKYINHTIDSFDDLACKSCHGASLNANATMIEFIHNVNEGAGGEECMVCHASRMGDYPAINVSLFGKHRNTNTTDGNNALTNGDCMTCHYDFNYSEMAKPGFTTVTYTCTECHIYGNFSAPVIKNHRPPYESVSPGARITTNAYCTICHNNSINSYVYSVNSSVAHYGTNASLIKPTVNQTSMPRFGFMKPTDASTYNKECSNCHKPSNQDYGNATLINVSHTSNGTCNECHVNGSASDLHNSTLGMPETFGCLACHTTYADKYGAPNLIGTAMADYEFTSCEGCHGSGNDNGLMDSQSEHNIDRIYNGKPGKTGTLYLNNLISLTVTKGTVVMVNSSVNDTNGVASRVGGAEYYIDMDPGIGKGTPMNAVDGYYNAANANWENVTGIIDTSSLSEGAHTVYVRGMDIGKQWSQTKNAILIVMSLGYINGTVTSGGSGISFATISATNGSTTSAITSAVDGTFNLSISSGTYNVTASKQPEYYDNVTSDVTVTPGNTTILYIVVTGKPTGTLSGVVRRI